MFATALFFAFLFTYAWLITPDRSRHQVLPVESKGIATNYTPSNRETISQQSLEQLPSLGSFDLNLPETLPSLGHDTMQLPVTPADDRSDEEISNPETIPDLGSMTARQLYQLVRELRKERGIQIAGYKALRLPQLREAIVSVVQ